MHFHRINKKMHWSERLAKAGGESFASLRGILKKANNLQTECLYQANQKFVKLDIQVVE